MSTIEGGDKNKGDQIKNTKEYAEDFGKKSELIIARALKKRFSPLIEETEAATPYEDQREATDIWIDFGEAGVVAVQLTFSDNSQNLKRKREQVKKKQFAKKEERQDAAIKYNKNAHLVLAEYDKRDISEAYKVYEKNISGGKEALPEDFIEERTLMYIMGQIINELPSHSKKIIASRMEKMKRAGR